jgi:hypothetical protein
MDSQIRVAVAGLIAVVAIAIGAAVIPGALGGRTMVEAQCMPSMSADATAGQS